MKPLLQLLLKILARLTIAKYHPRVIGITGSVGKTGSRLAATAVLRQRYRVGEPVKNLNNEIGLPLAILGEQDSGYHSLSAWLGIFGRALKQLMVKDQRYPEVLVLEFGVDHPGDMDYLLSIVRPEVGVITAISPAHVEFLKDVAGVAREKGKLVVSLPKTGAAVLNVDFPEAAALAEKISARVVRYSLEREAEVKANSVSISQTNLGKVQGMSFKLAVGGSSVPVLIPDTVGRPVVAMAAAGAAVGYALGLSVLEITRGLENFVPPPGRLRLIDGVKSSVLIDDTYNSSPQALAAALQILADLPLQPGARRWAILGDMLELGQESAALHRAAGEQAAALKLDYLVTVGPLAKAAGEAALSAGFKPEQVQAVTKSEQAAEAVLPRLKPGDVVLIKGSQGVRCERIVATLMAEPGRAEKLLVRQTKPWV